MKQLFIKSLVIPFLILSSSHLGAQSLTDKFQQKLDSIYQLNPDAVGMMIHVEAPDKNISWTGAVGFSEKNSKTEIKANQPALIASNTKTYVAVSILKLVETGWITLDEPIEELISEKSKILLTNSGYRLQKINVKHLLSHTSGITDYVDEEYFKSVNTNPDFQWTRDMQIERGAKAKPLAVPGKQFKYADINFVLLTEIIEGITNIPFYVSIRKLLEFEEHGLNATWFVQLEEQPESVEPLVHQYWDKKGWDSYDINPSWDLYGGGGLASTTKDLARFFQVLFEGKMIKDPALLAQIHTFVLPEEESIYCLGLKKINFYKTTPGFYHGGFWGTDVMYLPETNASISVFILEREKREFNAQLTFEIFKLLKD